MCTKRSVQNFATGKNFSFNQCHEQRVLLFSQESNRKLLSVFAQPDRNTLGVGEFSTVMKPSTCLGFACLSRILTTLSSLYQAKQTWKAF